MCSHVYNADVIGSGYLIRYLSQKSCDPLKAEMWDSIAEGGPTSGETWERQAWSSGDLEGIHPGSGSQPRRDRHGCATD